MAKVFFSREITPEGLVRVFEAMGRELPGKVAVKISTGEPGGHNFLDPRLIADLVRKVKGTIVECNTAYGGRRGKTEDHLRAAREHGFMDIAEVDIMDAEGDIELPVVGGKHLDVNYVGKNFDNYDSVLVLSHFKGHPMGGFGGALKNVAIGMASARGKVWIHSAGKANKVSDFFESFAEQNDFLESMAEAVKSVVDYGKPMLYVSVMNKMSVDCDCSDDPAEPKLADIGVLASVDPVALDQACVDLVTSADDEGKADLLQRIEEMNGVLILEYGEEIGLGERGYTLESID